MIKVMVLYPVSGLKNVKGAKKKRVADGYSVTGTF